MATTLLLDSRSRQYRKALRTSDRDLLAAHECPGGRSHAGRFNGRHAAPGTGRRARRVFRSRASPWADMSPWKSCARRRNGSSGWRCSTPARGPDTAEAKANRHGSSDSRKSARWDEILCRSLAQARPSGRQEDEALRECRGGCCERPAPPAISASSEPSWGTRFARPAAGDRNSDFDRRRRWRFITPPGDRAGDGGDDRVGLPDRHPRGRTPVRHWKSRIR